MRAREFIFEKSLAPAELRKRNNIQTFINKINNHEEFETIDGMVVQIAKNPTLIKNLKKGIIPSTLPTVPPGMIELNQLKKTKEFGGEPTGNREKIEQGQIQEISNQLERAKSGRPFIQLIVGDRTINAASVGKTPGNVKSDMTVFNETGKPVAWVSLKGHQFRWGGWTHLKNEPEISSWIERIKSETGKTLEPGQSYGLHIGKNLTNRIIYGKNFETGERGISNVDCVLAGDPNIKPSGEMFILTASSVYKNGDFPEGSHSPYLVIRYMQGRTDAGFLNARAETNTASEGRKVKWLDAAGNPEPAQKNVSLELPAPTKVNSKTTPTLKGTEFTSSDTPGQFNQNVALEVSKIPMKSK